MGSCLTKPKKHSHRKEKLENKSHRSRQFEYAQGILDQKKRLIFIVGDLEELYNKVESQARIHIKSHKKGKAMFALKRLRLYSNLLQNARTKISQLDGEIAKSDISNEKVEELNRNLESLIIRIQEVIELETSFKQNENIKEREEKLKILFRKDQIKDEDIYPIFAQYEAEANDITLTTSTIFKKSDVKTQTDSQNYTDN